MRAGFGWCPPGNTSCFLANACYNENSSFASKFSYVLGPGKVIMTCIRPRNYTVREV